MKNLRPVLRYHGGKFLLAPWILSHCPAHRVYTEAFGGAASVLLRKPRAYSEVYNDLDGDVVNLFRVLRDPATAKELARLLRLTPYARSEFQFAYLPTADPVERARRLVVRSFLGFGSAGHNADHKTGFRSNSNQSGTAPANDWRHFPDHLPRFTERLRGVVIEERPALDVLFQHDTPQTLHYVDPPYPLSARSKHARENACYRHEMTDGEHAALLDALRSLSGMVVLSSYATARYDAALMPAGWERVDRSALADGARRRVETLYLSPSAARGMQQATLPLLDGAAAGATETERRPA